MRIAFTSALLTLPLMSWAVTPTPNTVLNGSFVLNGGGGVIDANLLPSLTGYFMESGSLDMNDVTFQNFHTFGGTGSGGGAGFGGVLFINGTVTVNLTNVNFLSNTITGGTGGMGDLGGILNNVVVPIMNGTDGDPGGDASETSAFLNGGNGDNGYNGLSGTNGVNGFGGSGGKGGDGAVGLPTYLDIDQAIADQAFLMKKTVDDDATTGDLEAANAAIQATNDTQEATALADPIIELTQPWPEELTAVWEAVFAFNEDLIAFVGTNITPYDVFLLAADDVFLTATQVTAYEVDGTAGQGGAGGTGGNGGYGSFGFGGGRGGDGGTGGDAVVSSVSIGGAGGSGGVGGNGGFGGGGGRGGDVSPQGSNGTLAPVMNGNILNSIAPGGVGGFGGGNGSSGAAQDGVGPDGAFGNSGWGLGGAVFVVAGGVLNINGNSFFCGNFAQEGESLNNGSAGLAAGSDLCMMTGSQVTLNAGLGNTMTFNGTIADDSGTSLGVFANTSRGLGAGIETKSGLVVFNGANTYSGPTTISGGVLQAADGMGINTYSNIFLNGGILEGAGTIMRFLGIQGPNLQFAPGVSSGFSAANANLSVTLSCGAPLTWGQTYFLSSGIPFLFGSPSATNNVTFTNALNLNGVNQTLLATASSLPNVSNQAILTGVLSNGSLTINDSSHAGIVVLTAANTYTGATHVAGGTLILTGSLQSQPVTIDLGATMEDVNSGLASGTMLTVNGTFILDNNDTIDTLAGSGTINLNGGTLTLNSGSFSGPITGTDPTSGITKVSGGLLTLSGASTYVGPTLVNGGTLTLTGSLSSQIVTVAPGAILNDDSGGLSSTTTLTANGAVNLGANQVISDLFGSGTVSLASHQLTLNDGNFSGVISGTAASALVKNSTGTLTLSGANTYLGTTQINAGVLTLTGSLESLIVNVAVGATLNDNSGGLSASATLTNLGLVNLPVNQTIMALINSGTISPLGGGTLTALTYLLNDGSIINANLGTGILTTTTGIETLNGTSAAGTVTVNAGSTFNLNGNQLLSNSANVTVNGILNLPAFSQTVNMLSGLGGQVFATNFQVNNGGTYNGLIQSTASFTAAGGTLNLNNTTLNTSALVIGPSAILNFNGLGGIATTNTITLGLGSTLTVSGGAIVNNSSNVTIPAGALLNAVTGGQFFTGGNILLESNGSINLDTTGLIHAGTITTGLNSLIAVPDSSRLVYNLLTGFGTVDSLGGTFVNNATVSGEMIFLNNFTDLGILSPGFSPGLITIGGSYVEGGNLILEILTTTAITGYDQVRVGGTASLLPSSVFNVHLSSSVVVPGNFFQVIANSAGGTILVPGTLGSMAVTINGVSTNPNVVVFDEGTGRIYISGISPSPPGPNPETDFFHLGCTRNQHHAAKGIFSVALLESNVINTNTVAGKLALQVLEGNPCTVLSFYTPTYYGAMADYAFLGDRALASKVWDQVSVFASLPEKCCSKFSAFAGVLKSVENKIHRSDLDRRDQYTGVDFSNRCKGFSVGVAISEGWGHIKSVMGRANAEGNTGIFYLRKNLGAYLMAYGTLSGSRQDYRLHRPTENGHVSSRSQSKSITGNVGLLYKGWHINRHFTFSPRCNVVYSHAQVDSFTEKGAIDALHDSGIIARFLTGEIGFSSLYSTTFWSRAFDVEATFGIEQPFMYHKGSTDIFVVADPRIQYTLLLANTAKTRVSGGLNFGYNLFKAVTLYGGYEVISGGDWNHVGSLGLRICL